MKDHDQVSRFVIDNTPIRGQLVSLDSSWQKCLENCDADEHARNLLGQALAAVSLLASTLKINGDITLQIRGQGAVHLLVAQASSQRTIRGLVRQNRPIEKHSTRLQDIFDADKMVITINSGKGEPYQGIVPLIGNDLQDALEAYFEHSEQLPTHIWLTSNRTSASGLLLQRLPDDQEYSDEDSWNRVTQLASTITPQELIELTKKEILFRLFHEESVRIFDMEPIHFACSCSKSRIVNMIRSLGHQEANEILHEEGLISVNCEFCNSRHDFDPIDIEQIFNPSAEAPGSLSVH